jgi:hypothetical protein
LRSEHPGKNGGVCIDTGGGQSIEAENFHFKHVAHWKIPSKEFFQNH